jgi:hypothetical protein
LSSLKYSPSTIFGLFTNKSKFDWPHFILLLSRLKNQAKVTKYVFLIRIRCIGGAKIILGYAKSKTVGAVIVCREYKQLFLKTIK